MNASAYEVYTGGRHLIGPLEELISSPRKAKLALSSIAIDLTLSLLDGSKLG